VGSSSCDIAERPLVDTGTMGLLDLGALIDRSFVADSQKVEADTGIEPGFAGVAPMAKYQSQHTQNEESPDCNSDVTSDFYLDPLPYARFHDKPPRPSSWPYLGIPYSSCLHRHSTRSNMK